MLSCLQFLRLFGLSLTSRFVFEKTHTGALFLTLLAFTSSVFLPDSLFLAIVLFYRALPYKYPMPDLLCPKCGKPSRGVCRECYIRDHPILVKPESYKTCTECGQAIFKGRAYDDRDELLMDVAKKSVCPPAGIKAQVVGVKGEEGSGQVAMCANVQGVYDGSRFSQDVKWSLRPEKFKCVNCVKLGSGYYEAILQVRDDIDIDLDPKYVGSIERTRGGVDYYMISMEYARQKMSELVDRGFLVKTSSKLYGKKNGKDVFRMYYSLKRPKFSSGDFIEHEGQIYRIKEIGKSVRLIALPGEKHTSVTMHRLEDAKRVAKSSDARRGIVTEIRPDGMQLMDCQECSTYEVKLRAGVTQGQELEYVKIGGKIILLS
jgi:nonsense-mediated mRNA decay protein 3